MKVSRGDLVYIEWEDHCSGDHAWTKFDDCFHTICSVETVGFVVRDHKKYLTLAMFQQPGGEVYAHTLTVVKSCITKLRKLRRPP